VATTPEDDLDPRAVLAALGVPAPGAVRAVNGGSDTRVWRAGEVGLRLYPAGREVAVDRELALVRFAGESGLPVPRVLARCEWCGRQAIAIEWLAGETALAAIERAPWRVLAIGIELGRVQARIHAVDVPGSLVARFDNWVDWPEPVDDRLRGRLLSRPMRPALLHLDYHPLNVLIQRGRVSGVVDWANARIGDPRADYARTLSILRCAPLPSGAGPLLRVGRRVLAAAWIFGYRRAAGGLDDLAPFHAWAGEVMVHDLGPEPGRTGAKPADLAPARAWASYWRRRAGLEA
jgi:aminoglycoside phosphotransferase (APT) family kinase protein